MTKTCEGPECDRQAIKKGLCRAHYMQQRRTGELWVLGTKPHRQRNTCTFDGCDKPNFSHGLCAAHARQRRLGIELRPVRAPRPDAADGYSWCSTCKQFKTVEDFSWDKVRDQPQRQCLDCRCEAQKRYYRANRGKAAAYRMKAKYGIEPGEFQRRFDVQGGKCAICGTRITNVLTEPGDHRRTLAVDHDHSTGAVRGLLCGSCNCSIGYMEDDPMRLEAAAKYLRENGA